MIDEELFRMVLEAMWHETGDVLLLVDDDGVILSCNRMVETVLGWTQDEILGQRVESLVPHGRRGAHRGYRAKYSSSPTPRRMGGDVVLFALSADGNELPVDISLTPLSKDERQYTLVMIRDASERHAREEELRRLGFRDALTGLYNRHYFNEELARAERGRQWPVTLIMADIDGLKKVNDSQGHQRGDELIRAAAKAIEGAVRSGDVVARLGGDEFAALLREADGAVAREVCERIQQASAETNHDLEVRISVGFAEASEGENLRTTLRAADALMYDDKARRASRDERD